MTASDRENRGPSDEGPKLDFNVPLPAVIRGVIWLADTLANWWTARQFERRIRGLR